MNTISHAYGTTKYYQETLKIGGNCPFKIDDKFHTVFLNVDETTLNRILEFCPDIFYQKTKYGTGFSVKYNDNTFSKFPEDVKSAFKLGKKGFDMIVSVSELIRKDGSVKKSLQLKNARLNSLSNTNVSVNLPSFDD